MSSINKSSKGGGAKSISPRRGADRHAASSHPLTPYSDKSTHGDVPLSAINRDDYASTSMLFKKKNKTEVIKALSAKKNAPCTSKFKHFLKGFDEYGPKVHLTFKGKKRYGTIPGSIMSLICKSLFLVIVGYELYVLIYKKYVDTYNKSQPHDPEVTFAPGKYGFDMAFDLGLNTTLDPRYGSFVAYTESFRKNETS